MAETINQTSKTPGIVIFVAILNFISAAAFLGLSVLWAVALIFGNVIGIYDTVTQRISQFYQSPNYALGFNFVFGVLLCICLVFAVFFFWEGLGLLKRNKIAWYIQIALSVIGLMGIPIGTILNAIILIFFFQSSVREHFKV